jgi:hypothetical protein
MKRCLKFIRVKSIGFKVLIISQIVERKDNENIGEWFKMRNEK